jgi:RNA polymerase sigma-70 factor (ECF subfamily)
MENDLDDRAMLALREGRAESLRELIDRHGPVVLNFVFRMTGDRALAEDLSQETFLRVYRHASRYIPGGGFRAWLFTIARNLAFKHGRRQAPAPFPPPADPGPADAARHVELQAAVSAALDRIDEPFRSALLLCSVDGVSYKEAASVCGCSVKTISSRLARARARLRDLLAPHLREDPS